MKRRRLTKHEKGMSTAPLTVAITGASRGIGLGLAAALHERGDRVYGLCRNATERLSGLGLRGGVIENVDVTKDDVGRYLQDKLAGINIDVLVNNAGVLSREGLESFSGSEASAALEQARLQFEVNALGPLKVSSALLSGGNLKAGSNVVIVTSLMGSIADNGSGAMYGYRASKCAVNMIGKTLSNDLIADDISVQLWHPGYIATDMTGGTVGGGKRSVDDCILGFLELFDKMRDAGMEESE
jgi:NAD(P)-dependent dehydrogenase (short-subunit alcohol dehydrogenase family)